MYEVAKNKPKRLSGNASTMGVSGASGVTSGGVGNKQRKMSTGSDPDAWSKTQEMDEDEVLGGGKSPGAAAAASAAQSSSERVLKFAPPATATEFFHDMHAVLRVHSYGPSKTFCHKRLLLTEQKFSLHVMLNADREFLAQKEAPHRDFYNVRKVDTHVHHSACMNQKHLLRFIKSKLKREPHELVIYRDGKFLNLREAGRAL